MKILRAFLLIANYCSIGVFISSETHTCPSPDEDPLVETDPLEDFTIDIEKSALSTVCVLLRVTRAVSTSNVPLDSIPRDAPSSDYHIVPVARSYHGKNWQSVAGIYSSLLQVTNCNDKIIDSSSSVSSSISNSSTFNNIFRQSGSSKASRASSSCTLQVPHLSKLETPSSFILMSFQHSLSNPQEELSRFLWQATFGPNLSTINKFMNEYSGDLTSDIAKWINTQMIDTETPVTSHRAYFRTRAHHSLYKERVAGDRLFKSFHPCDLYSSWRPYSFTNDDKDKKLKVERLHGDFRILLSVSEIYWDEDWESGAFYPRTIVEEFKSELEWDDSFEIGVGIYDFCWTVEEKREGLLSIYYDDEMGCLEIIGGNPPVRLDEYLTEEDYSESGITQIHLPPQTNFGLLDPVFIPDSELLFGELLYLKAPSSSAFSDSSEGDGDSIMWETNFDNCSKLPLGDFQNLVGVFSDGTLAYFNGNIKLDDNTVETPFIEGGKNVEAGAQCPNVAKNFLNVESCTLSTSDKSCSIYGETLGGWVLNDKNNKRLHEVSGRYIYTIDGLRTENVPSPCTTGMVHRFVKVDKSKKKCKVKGIQKATKATISRLFKEFRGEENDFIFDLNLIDAESIGTCKEKKTVGMKIWKFGSCWKHSHPDQKNVYDFTYWTLSNTHPGNAVASSQGKPNPIKKWADVYDQYTFKFPSGGDGIPRHLMALWENNKKNFDFIGRYGDVKSYSDLPSRLKTNAVASEFNLKVSDGEAIVVCGSQGEVQNDPTTSNIFHQFSTPRIKNRESYERQKKNAWNMVALTAKDQLRQRMAWALSQIIIITPKQIESEGASEIYLNYYDIFVRNAFGSYFDILKEVSYSPMMAEMLSFLDSKGSAFVKRDRGVKANPDENYAREIMQLFSIGLHKLNLDGSIILDEAGNKILNYYNSDIQNFARAWTGFIRQDDRGNIESGLWGPNRMDPMKIVGDWRDPFPKADLSGGFIGDTYPLCEDLENRFFRRKSAQYRLLGSHKSPELQYEPWDWLNDESVKRITLHKKSKLKKWLCNKDKKSKKCRYKPIVTLKSFIKCKGIECYVDNVNVVKVSSNPPVYYEYVRPPCVDLSFSNKDKLKKISKHSPKYYGDPFESMCANTNLQVAGNACCEDESDPTPGMVSSCKFTLERVSYETGKKRCDDGGNFVCDWYYNDFDEYCMNHWTDENWHWTNADCRILAKVNGVGNVAIVHDPNLDINNDHWNQYDVHEYVNKENTNFFKVHWGSGKFPSSDCSPCQTIEDACLCSVQVSETPVFFSAPTAEEIFTTLAIGGVDPNLFGKTYESLSTDEVDIYFKAGGSRYDKDTIFGVVRNGKAHYFKNTISTVSVVADDGSESSFQFRNPPSFLNLALYNSPRDAYYETEAVLEHYFNHKSTAPFIAINLIKRFGIANPSPTYVKNVATAFKEGAFVSMEETFGDGKYGNLGATLAAILLDDEARTVTLDADPSYGSLKEPILKLIGFLRATEFKPNKKSPEIRLHNLQNGIGQMPHSAPNVFSFFLPEYAYPGNIKDAQLTSPEAQIHTTPKIIGFLNGIISLIELGLTECWEGFGESTTWDCDYYEEEWFSKKYYSRGLLTYAPSNSDAEDVVDELALLLTAGRLNSESRAEIVKAYENEEDSSKKLQLVQELFLTSPEFHTTAGIFDMSSTSRPELEAPQPSEDPYKAIVIVFLAGGLDSHNILVPHSGCSSKDMYENYKSVRREIALPKESLHQIDASSSSQECQTFGLHNNLPHVKKLYDDNDALMFANIGVLQQYTTKDTWYEDTRATELFAHNFQQDETSAVDIFDAVGRGIGGRICDILLRKGQKAATISVAGTALAATAKLTPLMVLEPGEVKTFNPRKANPLASLLKGINNATRFGASMFGELWSNLLYRALGETELLNVAISSATTSTEFPPNDLGAQLKTVAKIIKTKDVRGTDKDVIYTEIGGFDTHGDIENSLNERTSTINSALEAFTKELKIMDKWNDVTVVFISEFARTLIPNSGAGSDHAWGGNTFITGGDVKGGRILGKFPSDLSNDGDLVFDPGVVIPTLSWESMWNGIAEWFNVISSSDLDEILPNRNSFKEDLFSGDDLFENKR